MPLWLQNLLKALGWRPVPVPKPSQPSTEAAEILKVHNSCRAAAGVPGLSWDDSLTNGAAVWAMDLQSTGGLVHSMVPGLGENLAMATAGSMTPAQLVGMWTDEGRNYIPGVFPNVSRTGNWGDVGHYTQMIWRNTTKVGGAISRGEKWDILVCRYAPEGNVLGETV